MSFPCPGCTIVFSGRFNNFFSGTLENSTNFYVFFDPNQSSDIFNTLTFDESLINLSGFDAIAFGNCFPATYGISYAVGTLPIVSTNYICSNVVFENITGTTMQSPAINLTGGNNNGVGLCQFQFEEQVTNDADPLVLNPADTGSTVTLQNIKTERRLDTSLAEEERVRNAPNTLLAALPPLHVSQRVKARSGERKQQKKRH